MNICASIKNKNKTFKTSRSISKTIDFENQRDRNDDVVRKKNFYFQIQSKIFEKKNFRRLMKISIKMIKKKIRVCEIVAILQIFFKLYFDIIKKKLRNLRYEFENTRSKLII